MPNFRGPQDYHAFRMVSNLLFSMKFWMDEAFLNTGAYNNILIGDLDANGEDESILDVETRDNRYSIGQVWQSKHHNWVYESGISPPLGMSLPISISGIYIDSTFYPYSTSGTYGYHVDYINGRIILNNPIASGSIVQASYSYKRVYVGISTQGEAKNLVQSAFNNPEASGWTTFPQTNEICMPGVFIEATTAEYYGAQLGGGKRCVQSINLYSFDVDDQEVINLSTMFCYLFFTAIPLIDWNSAPFPLDQYGDRSSSYLPYDYLNQLYHFRLMKILGGQMFPSNGEEGFYWRTVGMRCEVFMLDT